MQGHVEHWFNRRWHQGRRDIWLNRTPTGWQVVGRIGGDSGTEVTHYFDDEADARAMLQRMIDTTPAESANWAKMTAHQQRPT
jgi:hypothetical protein